ncbi:hypothetical protein TKK_0006045 [Trichogramma kaykai]
MDAIIDIQYIKDSKNKYIPKEVAIVCVDNNFSAHWLIITPPSINLSPAIKRQNTWLLKNHHGLDYYDGEVTLRSLNNRLKELAKNIGKIYVRVNEKYSYIQNLMAREIINLEDNIDCPSFNNLPWENTYCLHHAFKYPFLRYSCSLNNTTRLKNWLLQQKFYKEEIYSDLSALEQNEQFGTLKEAFANYTPYSGGISSRSDPEGVDETDSFHI